MERKQRKTKQKNNFNNDLRTSLNKLGLVALDLVTFIGPVPKQRLLTKDERDNLTLAKDTLVAVRRLQLEQKRIKLLEKNAKAADEAVDELPELTAELRRLAAIQASKELRSANEGKQAAFRSRAKEESADA